MLLRENWCSGLRRGKSAQSVCGQTFAEGQVKETIRRGVHSARHVISRVLPLRSDLGKLIGNDDSIRGML